MSQGIERVLTGGDTGRRCSEVKKAASLWQQRMGSIAYWCGFSPEMSGVRTSDYDCQKIAGEECERGKTGMKEKRASNIELLRIIAMFFVVSLHYLDKGGTLLPYGDVNFTVNTWFAWLIEAFAYVAVNVYVLIAGYFLADTKFKIVRVIKIWLQVVFYSAGVWLVLMMLGQVPGDYQNGYYYSMFMLPITSQHYWFASCYIFMCLLAPFLGAAARNMSKVQLRTCIIVLMALFSSVWRTVLPMSTPIEDRGYGIIWFVCLFMIAAYIRLYVPLDSNWKRPMLIYILSSVALFVSMPSIGFVTQSVGKMKQYYNIFYAYNAPFTIIGAISLFLAFRNICIKSKSIGRIINCLASLTFGVYLLHEHTLLRHLWNSFWKVGEAYQTKWFLLHFVGVVFCIYVAGSILEGIRQLIFRCFAKLLHLNVLAHKMSVVDDFFNAVKKEKG